MIKFKPILFPILDIKIKYREGTNKLFNNLTSILEVDRMFKNLHLEDPLCSEKLHGRCREERYGYMLILLIIEYHKNPNELADLFLKYLNLGKEVIISIINMIGGEKVERLVDIIKEGDEIDAHGVFRKIISCYLDLIKPPCTMERGDKLTFVWNKSYHNIPFDITICLNILDETSKFIHSIDYVKVSSSIIPPRDVAKDFLDCGSINDFFGLGSLILESLKILPVRSIIYHLISTGDYEGLQNLCTKLDNTTNYAFIDERLDSSRGGVQKFHIKGFSINESMFDDTPLCFIVGDIGECPDGWISGSYTEDFGNFSLESYILDYFRSVYEI